MGSFFILLGASIQKYGVPQLNGFLYLIKNAICKPYEQMLFKTFVFATQIFVELPIVMGRLPEFSQNFEKGVSASIKS